MASVFPTIPYLVFCVLEPISLFGGYWATYFDTANFINDQYPYTTLKNILPASESTTIVTYQLGNLYGLMGLVALAVLNSTSEKRVARAYITCLAIGDIGHILPTCYLLGWDKALDVASWNYMAWGNIGATIFLFATRIAYLLGVFGDGPAPKSKKA